MSPAGKNGGEEAAEAREGGTEERAPQPVLDCTLSYAMADRQGQTSGGEAKASLDTASLTLAPPAGEPLTISLREILTLAAADYAVSLELAAGERLSLSRLGHAYEDFVRELSLARSEVLLRDMLMQEKLLKRGVSARYQRFEGEKAAGEGPCQVRVYETGLVVLPFGGDPVRLPFGYVAGLADGDYRLTVTTEQGGRIVLSMLGRELDPVKKALTDAMSALALRSQAAVKELLPLADAVTARRLAALMKDGRAARRADVDAISPQLWPDLEKKLAAAGMGEEYRHLDALARRDRICIGYKKGLVKGDEYVWLLAPVYGDRAAGNAIVMEVAQVGEAADEPAADAAAGPAGGAPTAGPGKATYLFRILSRKEYPGASQETLDTATDAAIKLINDCMLAVNFRREPVYLPDDRLREPGYVKYLFSVARLPELRELRGRFVGRVFHYGPDQWKGDLRAALTFNAGASDDAARWAKGQ